MNALLQALGIAQLKEWMPLVGSAAHVLLVLLLAWLALRSARRLVNLFKSTMAHRSPDAESVKRIETLGRVYQHAAAVAVTLIAGMLILSELGLSIEPILATAGVAGIAVAFGAQSLVKDFFTGLFLLLEDQVRQGDFAELGGKTGQVEEVTLRYVRLRDVEGHVHYVPNSNISTVTNRTREFAYAVIDLRIPYRESIDKAFELMRAAGSAMRQDPRFAVSMLGDIEIVGVDQWAEAGLVLRSRFKVTPQAQWEVRREFLYRAKEAFDSGGVQIPFPELTLRRDTP